ncbi:hypothetical protein FIV42_08385 [Persicimonas caeni]|uniref:Blue (type 1) copper domain-containing protein n=1 Tax=Persicimonas caeni TaxID=2292766 RepID=A0A4Y6PR03_PERCE|nr:plastocyanin/azurin family copper-binding protein [Persicimonas caeni]QDG50746.1 hypothetical protein FIV42_08385 [Persicimonas caeni]QED31967.1 hypothetical protein FRD00_08380 [Persicimonas caeni]
MLEWKRWKLCVAVLMSLSLVVVGCDDDDDDDLPPDVGTADVVEDVVEDVAEDAPADAAEDVAEDAAEDVAEDVEEDVAEDVEEDVAEDVGDDADATVSAVVEVDCATVQADQVVSMVNIAYDPATFTIAAGDVVRWDNDETSAIPHTVTSGRSGDADAGDLFDSGNIAQGESYCLQFNQAGTFNYYCTIHPTQMNDGVATVQ